MPDGHISQLIPPKTSVGSAFQAIMEAKKQRQPFSLVRLGDGEGAILTHDNNNVLKQPKIRKYKLWLGPEEINEHYL